MEQNGNQSVHVVIANYNTAELTAQLMFSLFRVLGRDQLASVLVVDNGSTDGSQRLLGSLSEAGLIEVIWNRQQHYHGPALNQALDLLAARRRLCPAAERSTRYVLVLDSDTVVLRRDLIQNMWEQMRATGAGLLGQFQHDALSEGYAHPSALLLDLDQTFLSIHLSSQAGGRFQHSGAPATSLHQALRRHNIPICDFPVRKAHYVLHASRGTVRIVGNDRSETPPRYHGDPGAAERHDCYLELFHREVPQLTPDALRAACLRSELLTIPLPDTATQMETVS